METRPSCSILRGNRLNFERSPSGKDFARIHQQRELLCCNGSMYFGGVPTLLQLDAIEVETQIGGHCGEQVGEQVIPLSSNKFQVRWWPLVRVTEMIVIDLPCSQNGLLRITARFSAKANIAVEGQIDHVECSHMIGGNTGATSCHELCKYSHLAVMPSSRPLDPLLSLHGKHGTGQGCKGDHPFSGRHTPSRFLSILAWSTLPFCPLLARPAPTFRTKRTRGNRNASIR
ncbi:hypothetical protein RSUY_10400 [Ralstonia solanacearum]|nr:hypothetical protein RSUY_10400 [Ralstonia solanacearum]